MTLYVVTRLDLAPPAISPGSTWTTDLPCHLWSPYQPFKPARRTRWIVTRGIQRECGYYYRWTNPSYTEQQEPGATTTHTFTYPPQTPQTTLWVTVSEAQPLAIHDATSIPMPIPIPQFRELRVSSLDTWLLAPGVSSDLPYEQLDLLQNWQDPGLPTPFFTDYYGEHFAADFRVRVQATTTSTAYWSIWDHNTNNWVVGQVPLLVNTTPTILFSGIGDNNTQGHLLSTRLENLGPGSINVIPTPTDPTSLQMIHFDPLP